MLEAAGYIVNYADPELLQHRHLITAYNRETREGYLIGPDELGLLCHYGLEYLNPHNYSEPRYKDKGNTANIRHYAEAALAKACTDVATSQPGSRNGALYRAAFGIGRLLLGWELPEDTAYMALLEAALQSGLQGGVNEAKATIRSGLKSGQRKPRDPSELQNQSSKMFGSLSDFGSKSGDLNIFQAEQGKTGFGSLGHRVSAPSLPSGGKPCL
jgi:hypothetical protein